MVNHVYPSELKLNKASASDTKASFFIYIYLHRMVLLSLKFMINEMTLIVNFPFLDGDVSHSTSYGVYISQLFRFPRQTLPTV